MSRGAGRLMRRVVTILERAPEREMNRQALDDILVPEGYDASNIRRAIKGLARKRLVGFTDRRHKRESLVSLPRKIQRITDDEISALLAEIKGKGGRN
jgi:hypothetical protein